MKKISLLLVLLCICSIYSFSQSATPFNVKIPLYGFRLDSVSFKFIKAMDLREDKNKFASVYEGPLDLHREYRMKGGFQQTFIKRIFKPAFRLVECGNFEVALGVKKLFINENVANLGTKKGRKRSFKIEVDYYLIKGEKMHFLYTDQKRIDTIVKSGKYFVNEFLYDFFEKSINKLDNYLSNPDEELTAILDTNRTQVNKIDLDTTQQLNEVKKGSRQEIVNQKFTSIEETPTAEPRTLDEHLIGIDRFTGTTAQGISIRYMYFPRQWDSLKWTPAYSLELDVIILNETFNDNPDIYDVSYGYFGVGVSIIKPINNFLFVDLNGKVVFGKETISHSPFNDRLSSNFLFGLHLNQRLMFMLGKGFGLYLTSGVYEKFMPTTKYLKTDYGISFGGGLKF